MIVSHTGVDTLSLVVFDHFPSATGDSNSFNYTLFLLIIL